MFPEISAGIILPEDIETCTYILLRGFGWIGGEYNSLQNGAISPLIWAHREKEIAPVMRFSLRGHHFALDTTTSVNAIVVNEKTFISDFPFQIKKGSFRFNYIRENYMINCSCCTLSWNAVGNSSSRRFSCFSFYFTQYRGIGEKSEIIIIFFVIFLFSSFFLLSPQHDKMFPTMKHTLTNGPDNFIRKNRVVYLKCRIVHGHAGGSGAAGKGAKRVQLQ